jgi:hypothetical protein
MKGARSRHHARRALDRRGQAAACAAALAVAFTSDDARALDAPATDGSVAAAACPDPDRVWSSVRSLVPSAADQLTAARPRVEIIDDGPRYRVRVTMASGRVLERVYSDPGRDCATRTRFASEFIVVALMPPTIADAVINKASQSAAAPPAPSSGGSPSAGSTSTGPTSAAPASAAPTSAGPTSEATAATPPPLKPPAPPPTPPQARAAQSGESNRPESAPRVRWRWLRLEIEAVGEAAPKVFGAPSVFTIGPELRARLGRGAWAGFASVAYEPPARATPEGVALRVMRVPIAAGARVRRRLGPFEVGADLGAALAIESYSAPQLHQSNDVWRVAPGLQAGAEASWEAAGMLGLVAGLRCTWLPLVQDLAAAPAGTLGKTPSLWFGVVLGVSLEP